MMHRFEPYCDACCTTSSHKLRPAQHWSHIDVKLCWCLMHIIWAVHQMHISIKPSWCMMHRHIAAWCTALSYNWCHDWAILMPDAQHWAIVIPDAHHAMSTALSHGTLTACLGNERGVLDKFENFLKSCWMWVYNYNTIVVVDVMCENHTLFWLLIYSVGNLLHRTEP